MWDQPHIQELSGGRLHLQHGPIDVVLKAWGHDHEIAKAYSAAISRFETLLLELTSELVDLRLAMSDGPFVQSSVSLRMVRACTAFPHHYVTPMAAVAGAVADELIDVMTSAAALDRAFVNDGGDIAVHLMPGHGLKVGVMGDFRRASVPGPSGEISLSAERDVRGIATSGAQGRSFSLGISDSVTVLATSAAVADVAATLIANAVNLDDPRIVRCPASDLDPDNELADRLVTVRVPQLTAHQIATALDAGVEVARQFHARGAIIDAALTLQGRTAVMGDMLQLRTG